MNACKNIIFLENYYIFKNSWNMTFYFQEFREFSVFGTCLTVLVEFSFTLWLYTLTFGLRNVRVLSNFDNFCKSCGLKVPFWILYIVGTRDSIRSKSFRDFLIVLALVHVRVGFGPWTPGPGFFRNCNRFALGWLTFQFNFVRE